MAHSVSAYEPSAPHGCVRHGLSAAELAAAVHAAHRAHGRPVRTREIYAALTTEQRARLGLGVRGLATVLLGLGIARRTTRSGHAAWCVRTEAAE